MLNFIHAKLKKYDSHEHANNSLYTAQNHQTTEITDRNSISFENSSSYLNMTNLQFNNHTLSIEATDSINSASAKQSISIVYWN